MSIEKFTRLFKFKPKWEMHIGLELEGFFSRGGVVYPLGYDTVQKIRRPSSTNNFVWCHELSRAQMEVKHTAPVLLAEFPQSVQLLIKEIERVEEDHTFTLHTVGHMEDAPTEVSPEKRCREIKEGMPLHILQAACAVAGLHVHIGMPDMDTALVAYNYARGQLGEMIRLFASPERVEAYKLVATYSRWEPPRIENIEQLYNLAQRQGFVEELKNWWALIRITKFGTIEFRIADATRDPIKIFEYAVWCHSICSRAIERHLEVE